MKATGEVMAIASTFEGRLMKAVRSLEQNVALKLPVIDEMDDERGTRALRRGRPPSVRHRGGHARRHDLEEIASITSIDPWFLEGILSLVQMEADLKRACPITIPCSRAKRMGYTDKTIGELCAVQPPCRLSFFVAKWGIVPRFQDGRYLRCGV